MSMKKEYVAAFDQLGLGYESHLLIDGRNCIWRAVHANVPKPNQVRYHSLVTALSFMASWVRDFAAHDVHVFWDAPKASLWRRKILPTYKDRDSKNDPAAAEEVGFVQMAAQEMLKHMNVRQYSRPHMEADDLIYAFCRTVQGRPKVVVSSDGDFHQLTERMSDVLLFEPRHKRLVCDDGVDSVLKKSFMGEDGDKIPGYPGIGPVNAIRLTKAMEDRHKFFKQRGKAIFLRNMLLIDLSLCPYVPTNSLYIEEQLLTEPVYDKQAATTVAREHKVTGFVQESTNICPVFKALGGTFDDKYQCPECGGPQRSCPSGWVCAAGHGQGEPTLRRA